MIGMVVSVPVPFVFLRRGGKADPVGIMMMVSTASPFQPHHYYYYLCLCLCSFEIAIVMMQH